MKQQIEFIGSAIVLNSDLIASDDVLARYKCYFAFMGGINEFEYLLKAGEEDDVINAFANFVDSVLRTMNEDNASAIDYKNAAAFANVFGTERNEQYAHMLLSLLEDMLNGEEMNNVTKFVSGFREMPKNSLAYQYMQCLNNGGKLSENGADRLVNMCNNGIYYLNGYRFNFRVFMKRFWCRNRESGEMFERYVFTKNQLELDEYDFEIVQVSKAYEDDYND